jgi:hypothetical protein
VLALDEAIVVRHSGRKFELQADAVRRFTPDLGDTELMKARTHIRWV